MCCFFFFKQKTAYEMRISDGRDVCSSDLRETVVAWDKRTGEPLGRAIVWQDRRTAGMCAALKSSGHEAIVQAKTGLLLDPYFSATKMRWLLQNQREVRDAGERLALGTVDSYLIYRLTALPTPENGRAEGGARGSKYVYTL